MKHLLTFIFILISNLSIAQWTSNTLLNTEVRDSISFEESVPLSATTTDGKTFISYFAQYSGSYQMRLQLLDSAGYKLFGNDGLLVSNNPQSTAIFRYDLKIDSENNAIIAFQDTRTAGALNIVAYKIDQSGNFIWGNNGIQLIDPVSTEGLAPTIGVTNANNVIISWNASSSNASWVAVQKLSPGGSLLWGNNIRVIDSSFVKKYTRATTVAVGADDFSMLYVEQTGFGLGVSNMYAMRYNDLGGNVWTAPVHVSTKTIPFFYFCKAVSDGLGGFFVGFNTSDNNFPSIGDVYVQHADSSGNLWNSTGNIACNLSNTQRFCNASRFSQANGSFWVLIKTTDVNQNLSGAAIQSIDLNGNVQLTPAAVQIVPTSAAYNDPSDFCITSDGVIAFYAIGNAPNQTINAVKSDFLGTLQWSGIPANVCTKISGKDDFSAGLFINNQVVAVWTDNRNDFGIYAQNVTNDGQTGPLSGIGENGISNFKTDVYPNPFSDYIKIRLSQNLHQNAEIKITDASGRLILRTVAEGSNSEVIQIDFPGLEKGVYFMEVTSAKETTVSKIIRN